MDLILQQLINALSLGGIYAMLALGLAIVFSIVRLINFAHGEIMTFGGYGIFLAMSFGFPPVAALTVGLGAALFMAMAMERTAQGALEKNRSGTTSTWRNPDSGNSGDVTPVKTYQTASGQYCREYQQTVVINGKSQRAYGRACREPDGSWRIVK